MAELPEIETLRRELEREVVGKKVKSVEVLDDGPLAEGIDGPGLVKRLEGAKVSGSKRRGLLLCLILDGADMLVVDLSAGGALRRAANKDEVAEGTSVIVTFTQGGQLRISGVDGTRVFLADEERLLSLHPELTTLGADLFDQPLSWTNFAVMLRARRETLRSLLRDDSFVVGLGDIYADEILHSALLRHDRTPDTLSAQEIRRLYRAIVETIHDAVKHGGTSIESSPFVNLAGEPGGYQEYLGVYGRDGQRSANGRTLVQRAKVDGSWTYFTDYQV
ncbi:MAG: DNA-formamidopyrimidine glycosylase family protein [Actinomycetota bacterium]|nr:DNA-formamidopyrimidine glycosylase family protein [Actinomycetota bacterium]